MSEGNVERERQKNTDRLRIVYGLCGFLVILAALPLLLRSGRNADTQAEILFLGDSIIGYCRDESSIPDIVAGQLETTAMNGAFGGTTMSLQNRENRDSYFYDALSFSWLAQAVAAEDFGTQQTIRTKDYPTRNFRDIVDELDSVDYSSIKTVIISFGMNDYTTGSPIANAFDPEDPYTMEGAMRTGIKLLRQAYPDLRIIFISPTYCWFTETTCETSDYGGGYLEEYVEALRRVAAECGVEFLDLYHDYYPHEQSQDWQIYTADGTHPNEAGRQKIAQTLITYLQKNN